MKRVRKIFNTAGTHYWTCPAGVKEVNAFLFAGVGMNYPAGGVGGNGGDGTGAGGPNASLSLSILGGSTSLKLNNVLLGTIDSTLTSTILMYSIFASDGYSISYSLGSGGAGGTGGVGTLNSNGTNGTNGANGGNSTKAAVNSPSLSVSGGSGGGGGGGGNSSNTTAYNGANGTSGSAGLTCGIAYKNFKLKTFPGKQYELILGSKATIPSQTQGLGGTGVLTAAYPTIGDADNYGVAASPSYGGEGGSVSSVNTVTHTAFESVRDWTCVDISHDGTKRVAGATTGIYSSTTGFNSSMTGAWTHIKVSDDGTKIAAIKSGDTNIYVSTNSGTSYNTYAVGGTVTKISATGNLSTIVAIISGSNYLRKSTDFGVTWNDITSAGLLNWSDICQSSSGTILYGALTSGSLRRSIDSGVTWGGLSVSQSRVECSGDGNTVICFAPNISGIKYRSLDSGISWRQLTAINSAVMDHLTISSDGYRIATDDVSSLIRLSFDRGISYYFYPAAIPQPVTDCAISGNGTTLLTSAQSSNLYISTIPTTWFLAGNGADSGLSFNYGGTHRSPGGGGGGGGGINYNTIQSTIRSGGNGARGGDGGLCAEGSDGWVILEWYE